MTLNNLLLIGFILAMLANAIAFVRHWRMMRVLRAILNGLAETQNQFNQMMADEQRKRADELVERSGRRPG